jgi:AcrR family transcriptional regulator
MPAVRSPGGTVARSGEETPRIRRIVDAAGAVMARVGYAATSMKDVAQEAGVAQGLIFYYFESKDDLLLAVVQSLCDAVAQESRDAFAAAADAPPLVRAWTALHAAHDRMASEPARQRLLIDMISLSATDSRMREHLADLYASLIAVTTTMVEELNREVPTPMPVATSDFATVIIAALDGLALFQLIEPEKDHEAVYRALAFMLLATVAASYAAAGQPVPAVPELLATFGSKPSAHTPPATSRRRRRKPTRHQLA